MLLRQSISSRDLPVSEPFAFQYTLDELDFVRTLREHARRQVPTVLRWMLLVVVLFVLASTVLNWTGRPQLTAGEFLVLALMILLPGFLFWWLWWWHPKRVARCAPYLNVKIDGTVSGDGVVSQSRLGHHETKWDSYSAAVESSDHFLLYLGRNVFSPFPKRAFDLPADVNRFRELIRAHVPNAKLLDRPKTS